MRLTGDDATTIRVPKASVTRLEVRRRSRLRGALVGAGAGLLGGVLVGSMAAVECESRSGDGFNMCGLDFLAPVVLGLPVGTIAGALGRRHLPRRASGAPRQTRLRRPVTNPVGTVCRKLPSVGGTHLRQLLTNSLPWGRLRRC